MNNIPSEMNGENNQMFPPNMNNMSSYENIPTNDQSSVIEKEDA